MKQEDKELLLKDLCSRLPYGVKCVSGVDDATLIIEGINPNCNGASEVQVTYERSGINFDTKISSIKPYLFPYSSIIEEQTKEALTTKHKINLASGKFMYLDSSKTAEFYNKNHIDYRGLIPKGLAIDATNKNIY